ncbi:MAG: type II toxin-antitoxin system RelE/ParE family toxin [Candidatus Aminicenantales bacterium]
MENSQIKLPVWKIGPEEALYRLRIGAYRVIFKKDKARLIILIVRVGHRRKVYY